MSGHSKQEAKFQSLKNKWLIFALLFFSCYAIVRYLVFKGVDPVHFPVYIVNKIFSITGLFFLALSYTVNKIKHPYFEEKHDQKQFVKYAGLTGFSLIAMHVFLSLIIISPEYFPKFYTGAKMNLTGELSMLSGVFSLYCFSIPAITTIPFMQEAVGFTKWQKGQRMGYLGLFTALLHTGIMGFFGWFDLQSWPGYLPPISLIGALIALVPLWFKLYRFAVKD